MENILMKMLAFILLCCGLAACSFHVGVDWQGKTEKSNITESPDFRGARK